jgi:hypothetical protein
MKTLILVTTLVLGLGYASLALADVPYPDNQPARDASDTLTDVKLGEMLDAMGMDPQKGTYKSGANYFDVKLNTRDYELNVRLGLSPNKRCIWLMSNLGKLPADVPAERLKALLQAVNSKTGKMQFRLVGDLLKADQPLDNVKVTASRLRRELDDFADTLQKTGPLWDASKWESNVKPNSK